MFNKLKNYYNNRYCKKHFPHEITVYIAPPGSGKTSHAARMTQLALSHGKRVFSNVPIRGALKYDCKQDFGINDMSNSLIILDEAGLTYDNRNFAKNFQPQELEFFKLHRHYRTSILIYSQSVDVDKKIRDLAQTIRIVKKTPLKGLIFTKTVAKFVDVDENTRQLIDAYQLKFFKCSFHWVRPAWKLFDSWDAPVLDTKEYSLWT